MERSGGKKTENEREQGRIRLKNGAKEKRKEGREQWTEEEESESTAIAGKIPPSKEHLNRFQLRGRRRSKLG